MAHQCKLPFFTLKRMPPHELFEGDLKLDSELLSFSQDTPFSSYWSTKLYLLPQTGCEIPYVLVDSRKNRGLNEHHMLSVAEWMTCCQVLSSLTRIW